MVLVVGTSSSPMLPAVMFILMVEGLPTLSFTALSLVILNLLVVARQTLLLKVAMKAISLSVVLAWLTY